MPRRSQCLVFQSLFGYDALSTGLVMSPAGIIAVLAMPIVGRLLGLRSDARWLIAAGLLIMTAGNYWMSQLNLDISPGQAVWPRVVVVAGLAVFFAPANVAAYLYTPLALRGAAIGLASLFATRGAASGCRCPRPSKSGVISFTFCGFGSVSIPSTQPRATFSLGLRRSSFNKPAIQSPPSSWLAATRKSASAAGVFACLFRHLLDGGCVDVCGRVRGIVHETFGG